MFFTIFQRDALFLRKLKNSRKQNLLQCLFIMFYIKTIQNIFYIKFYDKQLVFSEIFHNFKNFVWQYSNEMAVPDLQTCFTKIWFFDALLALRVFLFFKLTGVEICARSLSVHRPSPKEKFKLATMIKTTNYYY